MSKYFKSKLYTKPKQVDLTPLYDFIGGKLDTIEWAYWQTRPDEYRKERNKISKENKKEKK